MNHRLNSRPGSLLDNKSTNEWEMVHIGFNVMIDWNCRWIEQWQEWCSSNWTTLLPWPNAESATRRRWRSARLRRKLHLLRRPSLHPIFRIRFDTIHVMAFSFESIPLTFLSLFSSASSISNIKSNVQMIVTIVPGAASPPPFLCPFLCTTENWLKDIQSNNVRRQTFWMTRVKRCPAVYHIWLNFIAFKYSQAEY